MPPAFQIVGYARSNLEIVSFKTRISSKIKVNHDEQHLLQEFLDRCFYVSGQYDHPDSFKKLNAFVEEVEPQISPGKLYRKHRLFYMALPPSVFAIAAKNLRDHVFNNLGTNRIIIEKPFGRDSESYQELSVQIQASWPEEDVYRIDHYLGKEMVKNLMVLRFANMIMGAVWNRDCIDNVQITFKEPIGTDGRGGYFDEFGIIRDVIQNHLLQILSIVAMEKPISLASEHVRDEKVKVLNCIKPIERKDSLLGQYTKSADGKNLGYLDDPTVPKGSKTPTFAATVLHIDNERWKGRQN